jgi:acyl-CoA synthetase (NDP forming)
MIETVAEIIRQVRTEGRSSLTEAESKSALNSYGIPVVKEVIATTAEDAVVQSEALGFPVVLKGLGTKIMHKTERGLVKLNLRSASEVRNAYTEIKVSAGEDWEGCLIQPLVKGRREFVAGLFRDAQFGPVVMFGLGGVFTEALNDVTFRIAPFAERQARAMMNEIRAQQLLGAFRGEAEANEDELIRILTGLSRLGIEHPEITEVDINPLIVESDGGLKAVDALIIIDNDKEDSSAGDRNLSDEALRRRRMEIRAAIHTMTHAKSIAVVGATPPREGDFSGMFHCIRNFGFPGCLYAVNPNIDDIDGIKSYPDLLSLPEPVDLVIVSVPAPLVASTLKDCIASGNKNVHIFTAGFKETGEEECIKLQLEIEDIARTGDLRVVGPNCMGFYVPASRILTWMTASKESGPVSFISQSGGNAHDFTHYASHRYNIHFSKVISYGNALTLDCTDYLDYLANDEETRIITLYLEGVKDGPRLLELVKEINHHKPVIMMKGGMTESGARAVSSHTGSLAGGTKIWEAFFRQSGAVSVNSLEEMADVILAFQNIGKVEGRRTAVLGIGGGLSVTMADNCARVGLDLPALSENIKTKLRKFIPLAGRMIDNPLDVAESFWNVDLMGETLDLLTGSGEIDNIIISLVLDWMMVANEGTYMETMATYLAEAARGYLHGKPLIVTWRQYEPNPESAKWVSIMENILLAAGIPVYDSFYRAVIALSKLAEYNEYRQGESSSVI